MTHPRPASPLRTAEPPPAALPNVPLMDPKRVYAQWGPAAEEDLVQVLRSHVYVKGPHVAGLEAEFASYLGVARAVAVDSCTDALFLVLRAVLERRPADRREVIVPSFTFVATAGSVVNAGGRPVFADVTADEMTIDPASVARLASDRTAAVVPVHLFGTPADVGAVRSALGGREALVLEDAAQSIHATWRGRKTGAIGDAGVFSFYPSKNLAAAGDGGLVATDDERLADLVAALRDHGQTKKLYDHPMVGTNSRMDEMQAAVLRRKLPWIAAWTDARRRIAARYGEAFRGTAVRVPAVPAGAESAWHLYTVRVPRRDEVKDALKRQGIDAGVYYPVPLHRQTCFASHEPGACPVSDRLAGEVLSLPCFPGLRDEEQDRVIAAVLSAVGR